LGNEGAVSCGNDGVFFVSFPPSACPRGGMGRGAGIQNFMSPSFPQSLGGNPCDTAWTAFPPENCGNEGVFFVSFARSLSPQAVGGGRESRISKGAP
jgi:hypothetical protein